MIHNIAFNHHYHPGYLSNDGYEIIEISNNNFDFVFEKETILKLRALPYKTEIYFKIPFDGRIVELPIVTGQIINILDPLFSIETSDSIENFTLEAFEFNKKKLHDTTVEMEIDEFTDDKTVRFTKVAGMKTEYFKLDQNEHSHGYLYLGVTFQNFNGFVYARIISINSDFCLEANDSIIFLFEDQVKINYQFQHYGKGEDNLHTNIHEITSDELMIFENKKLLKVKLINHRRGIHKIYHLQYRYPHSQYKSEIEGQYLLKLMASMFVKFHIDNKLALPKGKETTG